MKQSKRKILYILLSIFSINASAQQFDSTAWSYAKTITANDLEKELNVIASDKMEGRETGKSGQKLAMQYLIKKFKEYGIKDYDSLDYKQSYPLVEQENSGITLSIDGKSLTLNEDYVFSPSVYGKRNWDSEIVFVGFGKSLQKDNAPNVDGKGVFIWNGERNNNDPDSSWTTQKAIELAKEKGASALFIYNKKLEEKLEKYVHYYDKPKTRLVDDLNDEAPTIYLTEEATKIFLKAGKTKIKKLNKKGVAKVDAFSVPFKMVVDKPTKELKGENVIAFIEGVKYKDEIVVITAHYDHLGKKDSVIYNGADDDGTGTVSLLEMAQAFAQAAREGNRPQRSILIMPVSGEEKGLLGSEYYTNHPIFPLENTVADLNVDMIGRYDEKHENDSNYIYLIGADKLSSELHELSENVNNIYTKINLDYTFNDENDPNRFYYRSDHYNFAKNNIPVIFYFSGVHDDYHKPTDTVEKIDFQKTEKVARLIFLTAWEIANRPERLKLD